MSRPTKIGLVVVAVVVLAAVGVFAQMVRRGFSTHEEPSAFEALAARSMRSWSTPADLRGASNPLPLTPAVLGEGLSHWADHCASCHGNDGKGETALGQRLYPRAPDMTLPETQDLSDGELEQVLRDTSREALQRQDLARRAPGADSHYRVQRQSFRELFRPEHYEALEEVVPGLVERLGYLP